MRLQPRGLALMAAAALTLATAAVAVAQDVPPPGPPPLADEGPGGPGGLPPMMHHHRLDPEAQARRLRDVLQLRADQDGALKAYISAVAPKDGGKDRLKREAVDAPRKPLTTPERLDREAEHLARAQTRLDATRAFYAALSPSQKKAFDALGPMAGGHPMMRRAEFRHFRGRPGGMPDRPPQAD